MEVAPEFSQSPEALKNIYVGVPPGIEFPSGGQVPLSAFASYALTNTPLSVNHQGQFPAGTLSFNLKHGSSLSDATQVITETMDDLGVPDSIRGGFQGTAKAFQQSLSNQPLLILAALALIYIVLGVLYESYVHPLTILSTLPSAGVGVILALLAFRTEFSIIAMIGVILLIGIVKKNAIMMIDFALNAERTLGMSPDEAIFTACMMRFRPIMMTTFAALLAALPLALGNRLRGRIAPSFSIAIVGGLLFSQILTLYTTPVIYLYLDAFRHGVVAPFAERVLSQYHPEWIRYELIYSSRQVLSFLRRACCARLESQCRRAQHALHYLLLTHVDSYLSPNAYRMHGRAGLSASAQYRFHKVQRD